MKGTTKRYVDEKLSCVRRMIESTLDDLTTEHYMITNVITMNSDDESKTDKLRILNRGIGELARISEQLGRFIDKK